VAAPVEAAGKAAAAANSSPLRDLLLEQGLALPRYSPGQYRLVCPACGGGSSRELSLALQIEEGGKSCVWLCHRATCGAKGGLSTETGSPAAAGAGGGKGMVRMGGKKGAGPKEEFTLPEPKFDAELSEKVLSFFAARGISAATVAACGVRQETVWSPVLAREVLAIAFPYYEGGQLVNIKYRGPGKSFWQVKGAKKTMYGLDDLEDADEVIIVEGEMDKLALRELGITNVISVPDGAPAKVKQGSLPEPEADKKFAYLWNCREVLDRATRIFLATDSDEPGQALSEELARRLGRERCWRVKWPAGLKDANAVLLDEAHGRAGVVEALETAEPIPIRGLFQFSDFVDEIYGYYSLSHGESMRGVSTGWTALDEFYRVVPGELTIVTGVPNSGKSEFLDALLVNLAEQQGWCFAVCSMEKKVREHARQLIEKHTGKPFFDAPYGRDKRRISEPELRAGLAWIDDRFHVIQYGDEELPSIDWVLNIAKAAVMRYGIRGLIIDPYNELDHQRPDGSTETEYVSKLLTKIKRFAQHHDVHVWFVAHPRQLRDWKGEAPGLYDISGSAHFINKADNGLVVHRHADTAKVPADHVQILVRKVRNKLAGQIGATYLRYDRTDGRYHNGDAEIPKPGPGGYGNG